MDFLRLALEKAFAGTADSHPAVILGVFCVGAVLLFNSVWSRTRFAITYVHELGHGVTAVVTGGGIRGVKIHGDSSGQTETWRRAGFIGWLGERLTVYCGYPAPAFLAAIELTAVHFGFSSALFLVAALIAVAALFFMRSLRAIGLAILFAVVLIAVFWFAPPLVHSVLAMMSAGALTAGGLRSVIELQAHHKNGDRENSDVAALAGIVRPLEWLIFGSYWLLYVGVVALPVLWLTVWA